jgi:predicted transcriptional regulator
MTSRTLTVDLPSDLVDDLDALGTETGRTTAELVEDALARYMEYERWANEEIAEGERQADAGELLSMEEVFAEVYARLEERIAAKKR